MCVWGGSGERDSERVWEWKKECGESKRESEREGVREGDRECGERERERGRYITVYQRENLNSISLEIEQTHVPRGLESIKSMKHVQLIARGGGGGGVSFNHQINQSKENTFNSCFFFNFSYSSK